MTPNEVLDILNKKVKPPKKMKERLQRWCEVYYGISLHTLGACPQYKDLTTGCIIQPPNYYGDQYQLLFDRRLINRHPREDKELRNWRFSQYRPITKAPFNQATDILSGAIFQDSNYVIEIPNTDDKEYIFSNTFSRQDLIGYFANVGIKHITEDPNGFFFVVPSKPYYEQTGQKVEVDVWFITTPQICWYDERNIIFKKDDGTAWHVDDLNIWRFYEDEKKQYVLRPEDANGYYAHLFNRLPITQSGGEWNTKGYYESYFDKSKAIADDFVATYSAAQLVDKEASHPFIIAAQEDCADCKGTGKIMETCTSCQGQCVYNDTACATCDTQGQFLITCNTCNGAGRQSRTPGQWMLVPQERMSDGGDMLKIVNPDTGINKHHRETVKHLYEMLLNSLHLYRREEAESGVSKDIDLQRQYMFISKVSNHIFDHVINDTIRDIIAYRNVSANAGIISPASYPYKITKPTQFKVKTSGELLTELSEGTKANTPITVRRKLAEDYADKAFSGDMLMKKKIQVINKLDKLQGYSTDEMLNLRAINAVSIEDIQKHMQLPIKIEEIIEYKGEDWFLAATFEQIENEMPEDEENQLLNTVAQSLMNEPE